MSHAPFAEKWWHFGIHWPCLRRYSEWFITNDGGCWRRYCYPCFDAARRRRHASEGASDG